jgi:hypothetical protein
MKEKSRSDPEITAEADIQKEITDKVRERASDALGTMFLIFEGMPVSRKKIVETGEFFINKYRKPNYKKGYDEAVGRLEGHRDRVMVLELRYPELLLLERMGAILENQTTYKRHYIRSVHVRNPDLTKKEDDEIEIFFRKILAVDGQNSDTILQMSRFMAENWRRGKVTEKYEQLANEFLKTHTGAADKKLNIEQPWLPMVKKMTKEIKQKDI